MSDFKNIKVIGFDADDTLWVNETYFRDAEVEFAKLLSSYETMNKIDQELFKMEMKNLPLYGYGVKRIHAIYGRNGHRTFKWQRFKFNYRSNSKYR